MTWRVAMGLWCGWLGGCHPLTSIPTYWPPVIPEHTPAATREAPPEPAAPKPRPRQAKVRLKGPPECMSVYVVSAQNKLFAFDPQDNRFDLRGTLQCPGAGWATPFSMAVSRTGVAHVLFQNGRLYRAALSDAACEATPFQPSQHGFNLFGMGYGKGEVLYVADVGFYRQSKGLARIDTESYTLQPVAPFSDNPGFNIELTPTGAGPLHGYFINVHDAGGTLVAIDTDSGDIVRSTRLPVGTRSSSLAIAWWGGRFYIFTAMPGGTEVTRYDPKDAAATVVATIDQTIVGAGVSTCAPDGRSAHR